MSSTIGPGPWCGTAGGYTNHKCRCQRCTMAHSAKQAAIRSRRIDTYDGSKCGKSWTYTNYGCRCRACTDAHAAVQKATKGAQKKATLALIANHPAEYKRLRGMAKRGEL